MTCILSCNCDHKYQDSKYGKGRRVHNEMKKQDNWRCTVCGNEKQVKQ